MELKYYKFHTTAVGLCEIVVWLCVAAQPQRPCGCVGQHGSGCVYGSTGVAVCRAARERLCVGQHGSGYSVGQHGSGYSVGQHGSGCVYDSTGAAVCMTAW